MEKRIFVLTIYSKANFKYMSLHRTEEEAETFAIDLIKTMELDEATYSITDLPVFE